QTCALPISQAGAYATRGTTPLNAAGKRADYRAFGFLLDHVVWSRGGTVALTWWKSPSTASGRLRPSIFGSSGRFATPGGSRRIGAGRDGGSDDGKRASREQSRAGGLQDPALLADPSRGNRSARCSQTRNVPEIRDRGACQASGRRKGDVLHGGRRI